MSEKEKTCVRQGMVVRCFDDPDGKLYEELKNTGMYEEEKLKDFDEPRKSH